MIKRYSKNVLNSNPIHQKKWKLLSNRRIILILLKIKLERDQHVP